MKLKVTDISNKAVGEVEIDDAVFADIFGRKVRKDILARAVNHDWRGYAITLLTVAVVLRKPLNPLWLLGAGALAGILGLV